MIVYEAHNKFFLPLPNGMRPVSQYELEQWEAQGVTLQIVPMEGLHV